MRTIKLALVFIKHFVKVRFISIIFYRVFSNVDQFDPLLAPKTNPL